MLKTIKELDKLINPVDFNMIWDGFSKTKYAIYNDKNFYLDGKIGTVDESFMGNTAIKINNENVAIWDQRTIYEGMENAKLASVIIHEMFHCFQAQYGEKRYGDEILGIEYPIEIENIALRSLERKYLYNAVFESDKSRKHAFLSQYFSIRAKREKLIGNIINYEKGIESLEGTAVFAEFQSLSQLTPEKVKLELLKEYLVGFTDINANNLSIRLSSYYQGMVICMIADDLIPDWKLKYQTSDLYLSDFILNEMEIEFNETEENLIPSSEIMKCVDNWKKQRDKIFEDFEKASDKIIVNTGVQITGFDPMNILKREKEIMHRSFLRVIIDNKEQIIAGPVKTVIGENVFDVKRMEWLKEKE